VVALFVFIGMILCMQESHQHPFTFTSPIGIIEMKTSEKGVISLRIMNTKSDQTITQKKGLHVIEEQIKKYFKGSLTSFDCTLHAEGTEFQKEVWRETTKIPFGKTVTYSDIAKKIGRPGAVRAVGTALGKNPLCIVVPCHRVVPKRGGVGNYAYGEEVKAWLLEHEKKNS
jgi:methylated-DNA-[protein]-cysteine S-methyltransferase